MKATPNRPTRLTLAALAFSLALAGTVAAQSAGSSQYRVEGTVTPAGAGKSAGATLTLDQIVSQPEPLGDSANAQVSVAHGWRLPPTAARLYHYALAAGWNLQGSPGLSEQTAGTIFTGPAGAPIKIGRIQYPRVAGGFVEADDTDPLLALQAFWVFSYWGGQGREFATPEAHEPGDGTPWQDLLQPGWNLFSPPYTVTVPAPGRITIVWRWDPAAGTYRIVESGANLLPLEGYWLYALPAQH